MAELKRYSPVRFTARVLESDLIDNWTVVMAYDGEGRGPWLADLAHKARWDLQDNKVGEQRPCGLAMPAEPGACTFAGNTLVSRMNRTQAAIYHLGPTAPAMPQATGYTDVSEATVFLALFGPGVFTIAEKMTDLDFTNPAKKAPFLVQGPFCHVPSRIVTLEKREDRSGGFLLACSRGYGSSMMHAVLEAGAEFGIRPAGENRFTSWIQGLHRIKDFNPH